MVVNEELEGAVLKAMFEYLVDKDAAIYLLRDTGEAGIRCLKDVTQAHVDTLEKIRIHYGKYIGYGFDFMHSAKDRYYVAVHNTKEAPKSFESTEILVAEGVIDYRFGWYITELPIPE